jgi:hypothetical protein
VVKTAALLSVDVVAAVGIAHGAAPWVAMVSPRLRLPRPGA